MKQFSSFLVISLLIILSGALGGGCSSATENKSKEEDRAISVLMNRKSVRDYNENMPVKKEEIETILKAAMAAPSGRDIRPWEFIVIDDKETLAAMAGELSTARMLAKAPAAIVVCGDSIESFYWYLDCAAATQNILLAAEALDLGAVWTASYPYEDRMAVVKKYTNLPDHILPLAVIPIGYPVGKQTPKDKFDEKKIHYNTW
ncbi:MAG: nitroreductase family protein [Tannerellaceae bacterium]|nr:nitroreductase family protein [Tannerellaceae bacterium]